MTQSTTTLRKIRKDHQKYHEELCRLSFEEKIRMLVQMQRDFSAFNNSIRIWDIREAAILPETAKNRRRQKATKRLY